jgi:anti-sigma regulatory factor (Ser/Thr protein kinase)
MGRSVGPAAGRPPGRTTPAAPEPVHDGPAPLAPRPAADPFTSAVPTARFAPHPRTVGWLETAALAFGGSTLSVAVAAQTMLYRVVQESLTNVVRHAGAASVRVTLGRSGGDVRLTVHDDGRGFDTAEIAGLVRAGHFGLAGMRRRIKLASNSLTVESPAEGGTTITVLVPDRTPADGGRP